ncbi:hypothetical protein MMC08_004819 [Hypocenomyce scalaris]|nr:hypothetical protein [Hypocenomyce scalaris]
MALAQFTAFSWALPGLGSALSALGGTVGVAADSGDASGSSGSSTSSQSTSNAVYCDNSPNGVAGSKTPSRHRRQLAEQNIVWCAAGSETYVIVNFTTALDSAATDAIVVNGAALLNYTYSQILAQIKANGDGVISTSGSYPISYESNGQLVASGQVNSNGVPYTFSLVGAAPGNSTITASDANGHQTTLGVLGAAVGALQNYMSGQGYGAAVFDIYDGKNQVGTGTFAP